MTEQEAVEILKKPTEHIKIYDDDFVFSSDFLKAYEIAIEALEKQIPKKPAYQGEHEKCPTCGSFCIDAYCAKCGQKIN